MPAHVLNLVLQWDCCFLHANTSNSLLWSHNANVTKAISSEDQWRRVWICGQRHLWTRPCKVRQFGFAHKYPQVSDNAMAINERITKQTKNKGEPNANHKTGHNERNALISMKSTNQHSAYEHANKQQDQEGTSTA